MKIAYFLDSFYPQVNGVVVSSHNTIREMARRGHEIVVAAACPTHLVGFDAEAWKREYGVQELFLIKGKQAFFYPDFLYTKTFSRTIYRALRQHSIQLTHFHSPWTLGLMGIRMARALDVPVVGTFHTFMAEPDYIVNAAIFRNLGLHRSRWFIKAAWRYNNSLFYLRCSKIVAVGEHPCQALLDQGYPQDRIRIIYNGIDLERYAGLERRAPSCPPPVPFPEGQKTVVYTGRISAEKNLKVLADAMRLVMDRYPQARWLVIGDGPQRGEMQRYAEEIGIAGRTIFTGAIPNSVLLGSGLLGRCALFATASKTEAQPISIIEAMLFGLPVVGVDARGVPDLLRFDNGILVPPDDPGKLAEAIITVLEDEPRRRRFSGNAVAAAQRFDIRNTTDQMEALYDEVIHSYLPRRAPYVLDRQ